MISGVGDGDGVDWRARMSSTTGGKRRLIVGVGAGDKADSASRAPTSGGRPKLQLNVGDGAGDDANSESRTI
jgi:hypothetical protein